MISTLTLVLAVLLVVSILQEQGSVREAIDRRGTALRWVLMILGIIAVIVFGVYGAGYDAKSFIYMQY